MITRLRSAVALLAAVGLLLVACGDGSDGPSATSSTKSPDELAAMLVTADELDGDWALWERFAEWPDGQPGVVPEDQRNMLPQIEFCGDASAASVDAAEALEWQAFTQLNLTAPHPRENMVAVQESLLSDAPVDVESAFTALTDGMKACLGQQIEYPDGEVGTSEAMTAPAIGEDRFATRESVEEPGGRATWDIRSVLIRDGALLRAVTVIEIVIGPDAEPLLTDADVEAIITTVGE